ncbi:hypothetical protein IWQ60_006024 [Tieghemiomyces parasiticus]|uniref:Uncharacterized protein n=1 Tax=Tieghemiomyces parasiticus TaxID=78921 RepID=A0A9W8A8U7_9FUNG|nr:hypothetical protein IWQ60_006024 [Tieghemiomyces parasiticus]
MFKFLGKIFHSNSKHNGIADRKSAHGGRVPTKDYRGRLTISHPPGSDPAVLNLRARASTFHHPAPPVASRGSTAAESDFGCYHHPCEPGTISPLTEENLRLHLSLCAPVKETKYDRVMRYVMEQRKYAHANLESLEAETLVASQTSDEAMTGLAAADEPQQPGVNPSARDLPADRPDGSDAATNTPAVAVPPANHTDMANATTEDLLMRLADKKSPSSAGKGGLAPRIPSTRSASKRVSHIAVSPLVPRPEDSAVSIIGR